MEGRLSQPEGAPQKVAVKTMKCKLSPCPTGLAVCPTGYQHSQYSLRNNILAPFGGFKALSFSLLPSG